MVFHQAAEISPEHRNPFHCRETHAEQLLKTSNLLAP
jgi:hypothetical protein